MHCRIAGFFSSIPGPYPLEATSASSQVVTTEDVSIVGSTVEFYHYLQTSSASHFPHGTRSFTNPSRITKGFHLKSHLQWISENQECSNWEEF